MKRMPVVLAAAVAASAWLAACAGAPGAPMAKLPGAAQGIEILGVELLADGDLARLNYRVIDIEAARRAFDQTVRLAPAGGQGVLDVMQAGRLGPLRQRPSATGKKQFVLFPNTGRVLTRGGQAALILGEARITGIPVS